METAILDLPNGSQWDTSKPFEQQTDDAKEFVQSMISEANQSNLTVDPNGLDGDTNNRLRQVFENAGFRLTINTFFCEETGYSLRKGSEGIKYQLEKIL